MYIEMDTHTNIYTDINKTQTCLQKYKYTKHAYMYIV